jgi:hypothetical protein
VKILEWASSIEIYVRKLYVTIENKLIRVADASKPLKNTVHFQKYI